MLSKVHSAATVGIDAYTVAIETHIENQLPSFVVVGLPDNAVRESRERVSAAIKNSGYPFPIKRIVVSLAPADVRKEGSAFDLPVAVGILRAMGVLEDGFDDALFVGELALDGALRPVHGVLSVASEARRAGFRRLFVPPANAREAALVPDVDVLPCATLVEAVLRLRGEHPRPEPFRVDRASLFQPEEGGAGLDFQDVRGQEQVKRALEVAAAGGHNILLIGPPGSGKTMLARRIPGILPPLVFEEAIETTKIHSVAGILPPGVPVVPQRPFRAPHHTISDAALVGGGIGVARPGEISLAHNGVLFLDELPEFARNVLEVLRQPLEEGAVTIARSRMSIEYPARFMLVSAMNPCPCGHRGNPLRECVCPPAQVQRYMARISGPLLDRIDIHVECPQVRYQELASTRAGESSSAVRARVVEARARQRARFAGRGLHCNAAMQSRDIRRHCALDEPGREQMKRAMQKLGLSARAFDRILKVGRTIADLAGAETIRPEHVAEAIQYRALDRTM